MFVQWWEFWLKIYWITAPCWIGMLLIWLGCKLEDTFNDNEEKNK